MEAPFWLLRQLNLQRKSQLENVKDLEKPRDHQKRPPDLQPFIRRHPSGNNITGSCRKKIKTGRILAKAKIGSNCKKPKTKRGKRDYFD